MRVFFPQTLGCAAGRPVGVLCSGQEVYLQLLKGTLKVTAAMAHNLCHRRARVVVTNIGTGERAAVPVSVKVPVTFGQSQLKVTPLNGHTLFWHHQYQHKIRIWLQNK